MPMIDIFCIVLSVVIIRLWWKSNAPKELSTQLKRLIPKKKIKDPTIEIKEPPRKEVNTKRQKEVAELKKQGYTDELIAVILPIINDGK